MKRTDSQFHCFGANNTSGPIDVAAGVNAKGGAGRMDFESETFVAIAFKASHFTRDKDGAPSTVAPPLSADADKGDQDTLVCLPILEAGARTGKSTEDPRAGIGIGEPGEPMYTLQGRKQHAVAFSCKDSGADAGGISPTLRAMGHDGSHPNAGGQVAVAVSLRGREGGGTAELGDEVGGALRAGGGGGGDKAHVLASMAVRRLTPRECERLQGFDDDYTQIPRNGKPMADGPRYKMIGNSWAVPCVRSIFVRMDAVNAILKGQ